MKTLYYKDGTTNSVNDADVDFFKGQGWSESAPSTAPVAPTPSSNAPFPNDPASMRGSRNDPYYIGPTNFSTIQKQYTPYQIEQATRRNDAGDIFWKEGVNIADIPASSPLKTPTQITPMPATAGTVTTPSVTAPPGTGAADYQARNAAASQYLTGIAKTIDDLNASREALITSQKEAEQSKVDSLSNRLLGLTNSTARADKLQQDRDLFKVKEQIDTLATIQGKIADAQNALNMGIIEEQGRPQRMSLLVGRSAELQKQGLASIQSLQTTAEIVKGNIELARAYASDSQAALSADIADQRDALNTLLDMHNKNLVSLKDDEKDIIKARMDSLTKQQDELKTNKDQIFDLALKYPSAFTKGGVTFLDNMDSALEKMLPTMSAQEQEQYNLDLQTKKAALAKAQKSGSGGGSGGTGDSAIISQMAEDVAAWRADHYSESDINLALLKKYGDQVAKRTDLTAMVDQALQGGTKSGNASDRLKEISSQATLDAIERGDLEVDPLTGDVKEVEKNEPNKTWETVKGTASKVLDFFNNL